MKIQTTIAAVLAATSIAGMANATVVLSDDFNSDALQLAWSGDSSFNSLATPSSQGKGHASTDLIGNNFKGLCGDGTRCVDLDGTTGYGNKPSGELQSVQSFGPGTYTLSFDLNGNRRNVAGQDTTISLGSFSVTIPGTTLVSSFPYTLFTYTFTTTTAGKLDFYEAGPSTYRGALLDNVVLSTAATPEPISWALMVLGIGGVGGVMRSRRSAALAV